MAVTGRSGYSDREGRNRLLPPLLSTALLLAAAIAVLCPSLVMAHGLGGDVHVHMRISLNPSTITEGQSTTVNFTTDGNTRMNWYSGVGTGGRHAHAHIDMTKTAASPTGGGAVSWGGTGMNRRFSWVNYLAGRSGAGTFNQANASGTVTITTADDSATTGHRTVTVGATYSTNNAHYWYTLGDVDGPIVQTATLTILDDESLTPVSLAFSNTVATNAINEGVTTTVTASVASAVTGSAVPITIGTAAGAGTTASDFTQTGTTLSIAVGATTSTGVVTIAAADNDIDDGNKAVTVSASTTASSYSVPASTTLTIRDNDTAGITATETSNSTGVTEAGTTDTFTFKLDTEPTANVTVAVASADTGEGATSVSPSISGTPGSVLFTSANWNTAATVTVTGVDDDIDDGTQTYNITLTPSSTDTNYNGSANAVTVSATTADDSDAAGVAFEHSGGSTSVTEATGSGRTDTFTVKLTSEPTANVTMTAVSNDTGEATASPSVLTFSPANWNTARTITVTGVDDDIDDGTQTYNIVLNPGSPGVGGDSNYNTQVVNVNVPASTTDDDTAGVTFAHSGTNTRVTEAAGSGRTDTFTVVLDTQPTANVTVAVSSRDTGEASVSPTSIVFGASNWNSAVTVTVTGVDDDIDDGDQTYNIRLDPSSTDSKYNALGNVNVPAGTTDDDTAGITFAHSGTNTRVTEASGSGRTDTFTVKLDTQPTANVTVAVSSRDTGEGTVGPSTLTYTASNWNDNQTVTLTGVDDHIDDGDQTYNIRLDPSSTDSGYNALDNVDVPAGTTDDDTAGLVFAHSGAATQVSETGTTDTFTVKLATRPTANVTVAVSSDATDEGAASPTSMTFTTGNWNSTQTVTVTGVDDSSTDGTQTYNIDLDPSSPGMNGDSVYDGLTTVEVPASTTDDDQPGLTVGTVTGQATEAGGTSTFTVKLNTLPTASVTVAVSSADTGEGTAAPATLTYTTSNWNSAQTVTVTGVDDNLDDDTQTYNIILNPASTGDSDYNSATTVPNVTVGVDTTDNDTAALVTGAVTGQATEAGGTSTFTVKLATEPTASVTVAVSSLDTGEGTAAPATLTYTTANWNSNQTVTVTGVDDSSNDGTVTYNIVLNPASTSDTKYNGLGNVNVGVTTTDDDSPALLTGSVTGQATEAGGTSTFTVKLATQPSAGVTVAVSSADPGEGAASPATLTFTGGAAGNWNDNQTVTVTGVDDDIDDGTQTYNIVLNPDSAGDSDYRGLSNVTVGVSTTDNDTAALTTGTVTGQATEAGGASAFTVKLATEPTANVTVAISSEDTGEGAVSPSSMTFTPSNWNSNQTVTVTGVDDSSTDGTVTYNIVLNPASGDAPYNALSNVEVSVTTTDNDQPGLSTGTVTGQATEAGGTSTFTVKLNTQPSANVTIAISSEDTGEGTVSPTTMTFTSSNWNSNQTITVTGQDDGLNDGTVTYNIVLNPASSGDSNYNGLGNVSVAVTTTDDDEPGIVTGAVTGQATEAGGASTFTVKLASQPTASVTIAVSGQDGGEGAPTPTSMTFTTANWNSNQTVTVTGQNDDLDDGDQFYNIILDPSSTDTDYGTLANDTVRVSTTDDDTAGITLGDSQLTIAEGGSDSYTIVLDSEPTADVTITIGKRNADIALDTSSLTFTSGNWDSAQTVTVTAAADGDDYADTDTLVHTVASADGDYHGRTVNVRVAVTGDEAIGGELPVGQPQVAVINSQEVTVVKESARVPQQVAVTPPSTLGQAIRITFGAPSSDVPLESGVFALADAEGVGTIVDIDVDPVPTGGVEVCLPVRGDLADEASAAGRGLTLIHYNTGADAWEEVSGSSYTAATGLVCASGVTDFSPFGVAYPDRRPRFIGTIADQVYVLNNPIAALTLPAVSGGDAPLRGPTLTPSTLPPGLTFNTATRTLSGTPTEEREATAYTWRVTDSDGDTAELQFAITVANSREDERARLRDLNESVIPELARALADGVGAAIGRRLESVIGGGEHMMTSLQQLARNNLRALEDGTFKWRDALDGRHFAIPLSDVPLNNSERTRDVTAPSTTTLWATGDWRDLDMDDDDLEWDGDAFGYHLGIDKALGDGKVLGIMASWFESDIDYRQIDKRGDEIEGSHESEMLSVHPYFGWSDTDGDRLWLTVGYGEGEIEIDDAEIDGLQKSDGTLATAAMGVANRVYDHNGWTVDLKAEGHYTKWEIDDNDDRIDGLTIDAHRLRASIQGTHHHRTATGGVVRTMFELGVRHDGGDGETGNGVEAGTRLDYQGARVGIGAHGRILVAHQGELDEWGVGGELRIGADRHGRGLSLTLTPTWGVTAGGIQRLWTEGTALRKEDEQDTRTGLGLESEIGYGRPHAGGLLTPYIGMSLLDDKHHYRMGGRFKLRDTMTLNLEAERLEQDNTDPENGIGIRVEWRW